MKRLIIWIAVFLLMQNVALALDCEYAVDPVYDYAGTFSGGVALVNENGSNAVIDTFGNKVVEASVVRLRSNGLIMVVGENDLAAFFDSKGNRLTEYVYDTYPLIDKKFQTKTYRFGYYDGDGKSKLIPVSRNKKYGFINEWGTEVIPPIYDYAYGFEDGLARICSQGILSEYGTYTNGKYGFIKEDGSVVLPPDSYWIAGNLENYAYAANGTSSKVLIDKNGKVMPADELGYAAIDASFFELTDSEGRIGIADSEGNIVIPMDFYYSIDLLGDGYFIIDRQRIVNHNNELVFEVSEGETVSPLYVGIYEKSPFAKVSRKKDSESSDTLSGLVNVKGEMVLDTEYSTVYDLGENLIYAQTNEKNFLFDYQGSLLCELNGNNCGRCVDGLFSIMDFDTGRYGYLLNPLTHPKVLVNSVQIKTDVYPIIINSRTMVPMRAIFEKLGAEVQWNESERTVEVKHGDVSVSLKIGDSVLYKNGDAVEIDSPAIIKNDRTLVPLRAISEALGCVVEWSDKERTVDIRYN